MGILKGIKSVTGFLTIIPVGIDPDSLAEAANFMYLFPLVGALIGFLSGSFAWLLFSVLPSLIAGMLTLGFLLLITGLHHTDGLLDFGDGIMVQGPPEKKIEVMHDQQTGTGGIALGLITLITTALCIAGLNRFLIIPALTIAEISAKLAMVLVAWTGKSAHEGINTYFVNAMHGPHRRLHLTTALIIAFGIAVPLLWIVGVIGVIVGVLISGVMGVVSNRHFKGVTGDVFGATNDLARMAALIATLVMIRWA